MCDQLNENLDNLAFIMCTGDLGSFSILWDLSNSPWKLFSENVKSTGNADICRSGLGF